MSRNRIRNRVIVDRIDVNSIDTASGIFVGVNYANNWSSHRKTNYGFGSISNSRVTGNSSFLNDNDLVDTPINSNAVTIMERQPESSLNHVDVVGINVNVLDTCAALAVGENDLNGWSSHSKRNNGQGRMIGNIKNERNATYISDQDILDSQINQFTQS
ncbi:hypothetical protein A8F94_13680 [Bacillus sp. FJAT-27225]|uniref:hypothetical protein n=1 Tax=Bacillus sp. FJAT-27225 TaxID=1743144 RepID=UPI00080C304A|nr:hypothetical protein [Bacillus sp. FJAT-27225]OCA85897.1 hypothetical protein A8F94_13680 [Bacillus sp. FJAT-27225]